MTEANDLPDAIITESGLKITPLDAAAPDTAQALIDQTAMILPHVKITELLFEVDDWTGSTTIATLGTPRDVTVHALQVESFFQADEVTADWFRQRAAASSQA